jgi:hypothetical protein
MRKRVRSLFVDSLMNDLPLARFTVDRLAELRANPQWFDQAWASENTRVLVLHDRNIPVTDELSIVWVKPWSLKMSHSDANRLPFSWVLMMITPTSQSWKMKLA